MDPGCKRLKHYVEDDLASFKIDAEVTEWPPGLLHMTNAFLLDISFKSLEDMNLYKLIGYYGRSDCFKFMVVH